MSYPFLIQGKNIIVVVNNTVHTVGPAHVFYDRILKAIKEGDWTTVQDGVEPKKTVLNYGAGNIEIQGDVLYWKGQQLDNSLSLRIIQMYQQGFPIEPMVLFMENLMQNPSARAVRELYTFLERGQLPITPDGHFLAYKRVRGDFKDCHSGTVLNKPAYEFSTQELAALPTTGKDGVVVNIVDGTTVVSMERNRVDDNANNTCSNGLHFCSQEYLQHFGGQRTVILKINPRDVVSIPADYNSTKGRACQYQVIGELGVSADRAFTAAVQETANGSAAPQAPEYDRHGRPLSMTKSAIKKRLQRAAARG